MKQRKNIKVRSKCRSYTVKTLIIIGSCAPPLPEAFTNLRESLKFLGTLLNSIAAIPSYEKQKKRYPRERERERDKERGRVRACQL